jgi:hypothetical protein
MNKDKAPSLRTSKQCHTVSSLFSYVRIPPHIGHAQKHYRSTVRLLLSGNESACTQLADRLGLLADPAGDIAEAAHRGPAVRATPRNLIGRRNLW